MEKGKEKVSPPNKASTREERLAYLAEMERLAAYYDKRLASVRARLAGLVKQARLVDNRHRRAVAALQRDEVNNRKSNRST